LASGGATARPRTGEGDIMRVGYGYDVHRWAQGRRLVLGGVPIDHPEGLLGHSDADVLVHAVCDALLGAAGAGDIGVHFPDSDPRFKDARSLDLLAQTAAVLRGRGFAIVNIDATVVAEAPKIHPYRDRMVRNIAAAAQLEAGKVNVKATTAEGLGSLGRGEGIAAVCVALIERAAPAPCRE